MVDQITEEQLQELVDAVDEGIPEQIVKTFGELTGIVVKPYTDYMFFDAGGNYLGDLQWLTVREIVREADIKIVDSKEE